MCRRRRRRSPWPPRTSATVTRYLEATGNTAAVNTADLVARVPGFVRRSITRTATCVKKGAVALHDRAGTLQAEARAGAGGGSRRAGDAEADRGRLRAPGRSGRASRLDSRRATTTRPPTRDTAQGQLSAGAGQHQARRRSITATPVSPRRSTASSRRALVSVGELCRRQSPPTAARHHRAARSDLREFQRQRAGRAAHPRGDAPARHDRRRPEEGAGRGRPADRNRLSAQGHARLCRADGRRRRPARCRCAAFCQNPTACCCPAISCASACPSTSSRTPCSCPTSRSAAIRAAATCWSSTRTTWSSSARSRSVRWMATMRVIEKGSSRTTASSSPACCARFPARRSIRRLQTIERRRRGPK